MQNNGGPSFGPSSKVQYDMDEIHDISVELIKYLEEEEIEVGLGILSLALSLGRLLAPHPPLSEDNGIKFVHNILDFAGMYFVEGSIH